MKIEAITTCVSYADFLSHSLLWNVRHFDRLVVVTDRKDRRTRDLCEHHHVECVGTDAFYASDRAFAKSGGINAGLALLSGADWVVHLDADIVLPPRARALIEQANLDPEAIYGIDRMMCRSFEAWLAYIAAPEVQHSCDAFVQANAFPLGVRVAKLREDGWAPIGFFQMWNAASTGVLTYPDHGAADRSDLAFARQWPRRKRALIPEVVAIHLASDVEGAEMGNNWRGRVSPSFGPAPLLARFQAGKDYS
jgi:hypothetical protein